MNAKVLLPSQMATPQPLSSPLPSSAGYERVRVVGKGAFGSAILYRRKDDDSLVILKEINLHDLTSHERDMALNEVALLSRSNHPNIITYYDSFEENGVLAIEQEYAEGGTLAEYLARQTEFLKEPLLRRMFREMVSAVSYLHDNDILHRDLKTANIFLTKEMLIKLGDFGISKAMGTITKNLGAQTILGTPHYLSPEMCEGRSYGPKSDVWALGCCLYEMASLQKAFDATSLPALVNKIVHAEYAPIRGPYNSELKLLIREMLKISPDQRPSAAELFEKMQPRRRQVAGIQQQAKGQGAVTPTGSPTQKPLIIEEKPPSSGGGGSGGPGNGTMIGNRIFHFEWTRIDTTPIDRECHSALYSLDVAKVALAAVEKMPGRIRVKQICVGKHHQLLLSANSEVFSWGENALGQLGHGDRRPREAPTRIEGLTDKCISRIAAGKEFSLFCADKGIVMACGNRKYMGTASVPDDWLRPRLIETLLREDIVDLACGDEHAVALSAGGEVFVWGSGENGRMGTGASDFVAVPTKIDIPTRQLISNVKCGSDCTVLLTTCGTLIAMGSNKNNKLNLNDCRARFFGNAAKAKGLRTEVASVLKPTPVRPFSSRVVDISLGVNHSGVLLENGHIHLFGRNEDGELGIGSASKWTPPCIAHRPVKALSNKTCTQLICGDGFTMAGTSDNELYFWGARSPSVNSSNPNADDDDTLIAMAEALESYTVEAAAAPRTKAQRKMLFNKSASTDKHSTKGMCDLVPEKDNGGSGQSSAITQPTLVLRLDVTRASSAPYHHPGTHNSSSLDPFIRLSALACCLRKVMVVIDSSSSMAVHEPVECSDGGGGGGESQRNPTRPSQMPSPAQHRRRRSAPEKAIPPNATTSDVMTWIQKELDNAEYISYNKFIAGQLDPGSRTAELRLFSEIDSLKKQMQEQRQTFRGHEKELLLLQGKMSELQTLQRLHPALVEPPPAYADAKGGGTSISSSGRPKAMKNTFLPEAQTSSACTIL